MFDLTGKISPRENYLRLMKNDEPQYICHVDVYTGGIFGDPILGHIRERIPGKITKDAFGVSWKWIEGHIAPNPYITEETKVIKDIRHWDKYLKVPWVRDMQIDWSEAEKRANEFDRENKLLMVACFSGIFELSHYLMGFEDALTNYIEEPEAMTELLTVLSDFKIDYMKALIDHIKPDMVHFHDDWGNKRSLFMSPDTWRKMIKPHYERIYGYIKSRGVIIQHHADCVCAPIAEDMAELGIDIWQGVITQKNIPAVQKRLNGSMALQGGIDCTLFDRPGWSEQEVRSEVRRCVDEYVPAGYFIPDVPNGAPLTPGINEVIIDELNSYGEHFFDRLRKAAK